MGLLSSAFGSIFGEGGGGDVLGLGFGLSKSSSTTAASGNSLTTMMDAASKAQLDSLVGGLMGKVTAGGNPMFSKESAIKDSQGFVDNIFKQFKETTLPQILATGNTAGVYNASGVQALADNAYGQAVGQAASVTLDAIKSYAGLDETQQQINLSALMQAFGLEAQATQKTSTNQTSTTKASGTSMNAKLAL